MPTYPELQEVQYYPHPEQFFRKVHAGMEIRSILDVGAGHGGVFDCGYWTNHPGVHTRVACDIFKVRDIPFNWQVRNGVDALELTSHFERRSFDLVQCTEVLEHIADSRRALEQLCAVAKKLVFITSADETHHEGEPQARIQAINPAQAYVKQPAVADLLDLGFTVYKDNERGRQIIAWKEIE